MTTAEATAEVFWMAFSALDREARDKFMEKVVADPKLREELEDLLDLRVAVERSGEPTRPLDEVLAELDE
jgi:uncharacterized protein YbaA (DUF1428 family)